MKTLVLAEHDNATLKPSTLKTITAAAQFNQPIHVVVCGHDCHPVAMLAATVEGVEQVLHIDDSPYEHQLAEDVAGVLVELASPYTQIVAPGSTFGKNILPRVAALLDVMQISDVIEIIDSNTFVRPIYAGNAQATVQSHDPIKVLTVRTTAFDAATLRESAAPIERLEGTVAPTRAKFVSHALNTSDRPELTAARVVISGGRGLQSGENFKLIEALADQFNAAIGASRAAVDAGFVPNDYQVGQTGKAVAPDLYIAIGISGAIQHIAGMKDSKVIVAINKDEDAPIFEIADLGLVGDLFEIVPELIQALEAR